MSYSFAGRLGRYYDLAADVRYSKSHVPIRQLVTPNEPLVRKLAQILHKSLNFVEAAQSFVNSFTEYAEEVGDYWETASESLERGYCDCDGKAILLCSILRNYIPPENVFCAVGTLKGISDAPGGHMWVVMEGENGEDRIIEATAPPTKPLRGDYSLLLMFNDVYAFSTVEGMNEFDLQPVEG